MGNPGYNVMSILPSAGRAQGGFDVRRQVVVSPAAMVDVPAIQALIGLLRAAGDVAIRLTRINTDADTAVK